MSPEVDGREGARVLRGTGAVCVADQEPHVVRENGMWSEPVGSCCLSKQQCFPKSPFLWKKRLGEWCV